jgi:hypothetical protein
MKQDKENGDLLIHNLKQKWDNEDAARDKLSDDSLKIFREEQASQIFAPIEDYFTRLDQVLHAVGASMVIDPKWEHLPDQRLRRVANVTFGEHRLSLDFIIQGVNIYFRNTTYRLSRGIEALLPTVTDEVERFFKTRPADDVIE